MDRAICAWSVSASGTSRRTSSSCWARSGCRWRRFEVLVRGAILALGERRALARLTLASRRAAAGNAAVERAGLDLRLDEVDRSSDPLGHGPGDLRLLRDGEIAADVLEERLVRACGERRDIS